MYHNQIKHCRATEDLTNSGIGGQKEYLPITKQKILDKHVLHLKKGHHLRILGKITRGWLFPMTMLLTASSNRTRSRHAKHSTAQKEEQGAISAQSSAIKIFSIPNAYVISYRSRIKMGVRNTTNHNKANGIARTRGGQFMVFREFLL